MQPRQGTCLNRKMLLSRLHCVCARGAAEGVHYKGIYSMRGHTWEALLGYREAQDGYGEYPKHCVYTHPSAVQTED